MTSSTSTVTRLWLDILEVVRHCPSPHNVQPWKVKIMPDGTLELLIDGSRTFPFTDHTGSFIISTMGMFLAYCEIAAQNRGYVLDSEIENVTSIRLGSPLSLFARLSLEKQTDLPKHMFGDADLISRKTSRTENLHRPVSADAHAELTKVVEKFGYTIKFTDDQVTIESVLQRNISALFADVNDWPYFSELKPFLMTGPKSEAKDGLHYKVMNMSKLELLFLKHLPQVVQVPVVETLMRWVYRRQIGHCENLAFISGDFWKRTDALNAGRMLITFWLTLNRYGIYIHPFGNLVTNLDARKDVEGEIGIENMWFVCRVGYTDEPEESNRFSVAEIATVV
jgi:hypothetical protein